MINLGQIGMQPRCRCDRRGELRFQRQAALLQLSEPAINGDRRRPISQCIDQALDLAAHPVELRLSGGTIASDGGLLVVPLGREFADKNPEQVGVHQPVGQAIQRRALQHVTPDRQAVRAGRRALVARRRAAEGRGSGLGKPATAYTAPHQAGEQITWPLLRPERPLGFGGRIVRPFQFDLPRPNGVPQLLRDDAQMRHVHLDQPVIGVGTRPPAASLRVLDVISRFQTRRPM